MEKRSANFPAHLGTAVRATVILVPVAAIVVSLIFWVGGASERLLLDHPFRRTWNHSASYNRVVINISRAGVGIRNRHADYELDGILSARDPNWAWETDLQAPSYWSGPIRRLSDHSILAVRVTKEQYTAPTRFSGVVSMGNVWAMTVMIGHASIVTVSGAIFAMMASFLCWRRWRRSVPGFAVIGV